MIFFDTNILVYLFDTSARDKRSRAKEMFERHGPSGEAVVSTQVLQEFYVAVTRKLSRPGRAVASIRSCRSGTV